MSEASGGATPVNRVPNASARPLEGAQSEAEMQRFRWLDLARGRGGAEGPAGAEGEQQRLRLHVANAGRILSPKGPIHAFVAQNPLQGMEHLPFDRAVREAHRVVGGRGYLSNGVLRRIVASGRITRDDLFRALEIQVPHLTRRPPLEARGAPVEARDICLVQVLHGIDPLPHGTLQWQVTHAKATRRFRQDVPPATRATILNRARRELQDSLLRVGEAWTLAEWLDAQMGLGLVGAIQARIGESLRNSHEGHGLSHQGTRQASQPFWGTWRASANRWTAWIARTPAAHVDRCLGRLGIPASRREEYLRCLDRHHAACSGPGREVTLSALEFSGLWLHNEWQVVREAAPRHLGIPGTLAAIQHHFQRDLEAYTIAGLWAAVLATLRLGDPVSVEEKESHAGEALLGRVFAVARDEEPLMPLPGNITVLIQGRSRRGATASPRGRAAWTSSAKPTASWSATSPGSART